MKAIINNIHQIDLNKPIDISIPLSNTDDNPIAWYLSKPSIQPVQMDNWTGSVAAGSSTNFNNISFNPHAHGTHTECIGHLTNEFYSVNKTLDCFFFLAKLITVMPEKINDDYQIGLSQIEPLLHDNAVCKALIIRTLPNEPAKKSRKYSNTNPPYITKEAALFIKKQGVKHLLVDLPSLDKEKDDGQLEAHKAFWNIKTVNPINQDARFEATITEMIFANNDIEDGFYYLNLQIAPFENDATPSKPILYKIENFL
ncbi:cyclase family protein [Flavobacterium branchiophilum]|uniref:Probable arylformamidase n=1 Tax=Flavobacterium branchiophilum (strain FL-15) TaxID=1034807 RepID=G2Z770_FLABF|nr:cyclase family protein [Flavobacterium branchiophilum]CCB69147.1 Probable arylformamidase [Flavobacterium branchiophilum FL-15]